MVSQRLTYMFIWSPRDSHHARPGRPMRGHRVCERIVRIVRCQHTLMRRWHDQCASDFWRDVCEEEHEVESERHVPDGWLDSDLVRVEVHGRVAGTRDIGCVAEEVRVFAQEVGDEGREGRVVVEEVDEFLALYTNSIQ